MSKAPTVAFTGHRPQKLGGFDENNPVARGVKERLRRAIHDAIEQGYRRFISGGALGVDQWAAEIVIEWKDAGADVELVIAVPFPSQDAKWPESSRRRYRRILRAADEVVNVSEDPYSAAKMQLRNEWMVDRCDLLIAVWDGSHGGTCNCYRYAKEKGREVWHIDPARPPAR